MAVATTTAIVAGVTAAAGAYSAHQQAQAGKAASRAGYQSAQTAAMNAGAEAGALLFQAEEARRQSQVDAEKIMVKARQFRSSQRAVAAASGVLIDSGTAAMMEEETDNLARADALATLFDGGKKWVAGKVGAENIIQGGTSNAAALIAQGNAKASQLQGQAVGTLLSTAASVGTSIYSGINRTTGPKTVMDPFPWASGNRGMAD